jgi:hypothetical protein
MEGASKKTILRIELWHGLMLLALLAALTPGKWIDPGALLLGGLFMGINFFLLSFGVSWVLAPLAGKRKVKMGVSLLVLKILLFIGVLTVIFFKFRIDALSFALGFSTLIMAIMVEALRMKFKAGI